MKNILLHTNKLIPENHASLWYANLDINLKQQEYYKKVLCKDELNRAQKFRFVKDKNAYIAARGLDLDPQEIEFEYETYGKPKYKFSTKLQFNVSHSGNMVVIAFLNTFTMGVDVEHIKNDFDTLEIAQNFFSKAEIKALGDFPKELQHQVFFRCWTRKESFIKAKGSGLSFPLDAFTVSIDKDNDAKLLETHWNPKEKKEWKLFSFIPSPGYIGALAVQGKVNTITLNKWKH